ncbi:hypothetical protein [Sutcliffiella cohnii]|uniref:hypothetical protein n=1 Tax=Sutcliffiella cohnii TaxID=33932 RepID=UPI00082B8EBE|nr:hypothetical protein [Sutcliffiella cohnii]
MKLVDVLTNQEHKKVKELQQCLVEAKTRREITYYKDEIHKILDRAEARYQAYKEINHNEQAASIGQYQISYLRT